MVHENPCVICRAEYEAGERCGVLPRCAHVFHKNCIAAWLRHHTTCPICNAPVLLLALAPPPQDNAFYY
jgi:E3 ubiquitin-protein ligase ATL6/9/15/31/42/55